MKIVCIKCQCEFRPKKIGVSLLETSGGKLREPYKLWNADLLSCPGCGIEIISGLGNNPVAHHNDKRFQALLAAATEEELYYDYERPVKR